MMAENAPVTYFNAILPLRLEWEPCYFTTPELPLRVGDRVRVPLAGKEYVAVVSELDVKPEVAVNRVQKVIGKAGNLDPIGERELKFWRFIADYYLCTAGEVYKTAYPAGKQAVESKKSKLTLSRPEESRRHPLSSDEKETVRAVLEEMDAGRGNIVLRGRKRVGIYCELARRMLDEGKAVLVLAPNRNAVASLQQELQMWFPGKVMGCSSADSAASIRELGHLLRRGEPRIVVGTRQAVFQPFSRLGLIIIDQEQDSAFKQDSPSPRFNARDAALVLGSIHGAAVILGSPYPSLEAMHNVRVRKFSLVDASGAGDTAPAPVLIDTSVEMKKNGMDGSFSKILSMKAAETVSQKGKVLMVVPWKDTSDLEIEWRERFPSVRVKFSHLSSVMGADLRKYGLVGLLAADYIGPKDDFRADEKGRRVICSLLDACSEGALFVQTRNAGGALFTATDEMMLSERREFLFPPFTRMVDICIRDNNDKRLSLMSRHLQQKLSSLVGRWAGVNVEYRPGTVRVFLPKDRLLQERKDSIRNIISTFEGERKYNGHIFIDVDPI